MLHTTYVDSVKQFVSTENKAAKAFNTLLSYADATLINIQQETAAETASVMRDLFKAQEKEAQDQKIVDTFPTAYRSAKSVILSAVNCGISLRDSDGNLKGKSAIEKETKEAKEPVSELVKFQRALANASQSLAKMSTRSEIVQAEANLLILCDQVMKAKAAMSEVKLVA